MFFMIFYDFFIFFMIFVMIFDAEFYVFNFLYFR